MAFQLPLPGLFGIVGLPVAVGILYHLGLIIYRLYFHPLAKFPGPRFNAISPIPGVLSLLNGRLPMDNKLLHDIYGPVVRVSPNELAFNGAQAWEDIYGHRSGHKNMPKDPIHVGSVAPIPGASNLTGADDATHARQRRAMAHSFSLKAIVEQEPIVHGYVTKLMANLRRLSDEGKEFNLVNWLEFTTFDIIGDLAFKDPFGCLDTGGFHFWVTLIFETIKVGAIVQATRRFATAGSPLQRLLLRMTSKARQPALDHLNMSREKVMKRLENVNDDHRDFIWYILKQREKLDISTNEIVMNSALFIIAGSETSSIALSGLLARLLRSPTKYTALTTEVRNSFTSESQITFDATTTLPYLNACLEEGLRIHPPVPVGLLRTVPEGGDTIDGYFVPGGTTVAVGSWAASHNPANFRFPDEFLPERWLDGEEEFAGDEKRALRPFSLGPRGCVGKSLAYMEMRLILSRLLWNFDIESVDGAPLWDPAGEVKYMKAFMVWDKPEVLVKVKPVTR